MPDEKQSQQPASPTQTQQQTAQPATQGNTGASRTVEAEPAPIEHSQGFTKGAETGNLHKEG